MAEEIERKIWGHTFNIDEDHVGILGLGRTVQVIDDGKVVDEATIYGGTLNKMIRHNKAEDFAADSLARWQALPDDRLIEEVATILQIDQDLVARTNADLPERFQRPHPSA